MLIKRKPYPMPKIYKIIQNRSGYSQKARNTTLSLLQMANFASTPRYLWASRSVPKKLRLSWRRPHRIWQLLDTTTILE